MSYAAETCAVPAMRELAVYLLSFASLIPPTAQACGPLPFMWPWAATGQRDNCHHALQEFKEEMIVVYQSTKDFMLHPGGPDGGVACGG